MAPMSAILGTSKAEVNEVMTFLRLNTQDEARTEQLRCVR